MNPPRRPRKYLPAEGYRFLALLMLASRGGTGASKGEIAWETRANHYMATRVLRELAGEGLVVIDGSPSTGFVVRISDAGRRFLRENREYFVLTFRRILRDHFRFGRAPAWLPELRLSVRWRERGFQNVVSTSTNATR